jgi:hypothetical protein
LCRASAADQQFHTISTSFPLPSSLFTLTNTTKSIHLRL